MSKKLSIKPVHLVFIGLAIIVLGILIPSFFINPFSTVGFSVIIGSIILLSAYVFFAVNLVKSKGKKTIKWLALPVILALLVSGGLFANYKYQQHLNDKIYSVSEDINFSDFTLAVDNPSFSAVELTVPQDKVSRYGGLDVTEDCSKYPEDNDRPANHHNSATGQWVFYDEDEWERDHPTKRYCEWRNNSRKDLQAYIADNQRVSIDYTITAKNNVKSDDIQVTVVLDSGRGYKNPSTMFDHDPLLSTNYAPAFNYSHKTYSETKLGGDINKGTNRSQNISFDVRNSEKTIDLKVTYQGNSRIIRIQNDRSKER